MTTLQARPATRVATPVPVRARRQGYHAEILLVSFAVLLIEVCYTRVISFKLFYYYTYLVIGLALLGLGAGGVLVALSAPTAPGAHRQRAAVELLARWCRRGGELRRRGLHLTRLLGHLGLRHVGLRQEHGRSPRHLRLHLRPVRRAGSDHHDPLRPSTGGSRQSVFRRPGGRRTGVCHRDLSDRLHRTTRRDHVGGRGHVPGCRHRSRTDPTVGVAIRRRGTGVHRGPDRRPQPAAGTAPRHVQGQLRRTPADLLRVELDLPRGRHPGVVGRPGALPRRDHRLRHLQVERPRGLAGPLRLRRRSAAPSPST